MPCDGEKQTSVDVQDVAVCNLHLNFLKSYQTNQAPNWTETETNKKALK
jgi:hypothetical protein